MSVFNAFFRAKKDTAVEREIPWPVTPAALEGAVVVGRIGTSVNYLWHAVLQNPDDYAILEAAPQFMAPTYALLKNHANAIDVLLCEFEEDDPENRGKKVRRRVKMRDKPATGVLAEDLPPHFFGGVEA